MSQVAFSAELHLPYEQMLIQRGGWLEPQTDDLISYNACHIANRLGAAAIVAFTESGSTARRVSKYRPGTPVLAVTVRSLVRRRMTLLWGVQAFQVAESTSIDELFAVSTWLTRELGLAKSGDLIVITGGVPVGRAGTTNLLKVEKIP